MGKSVRRAGQAEDKVVRVEMKSRPGATVYAANDRDRRRLEVIDRIVLRGRGAQAAGPRTEPGTAGAAHSAR